MNIKVVVERNADGKVFMFVPSFPGVVAEGRDEGEAISDIQNQIKSFLTSEEEDFLSSTDGEVRELEL